MTRAQRLPALLLTLSSAVLLAACSAAAPPSSTASPTASPSTAAPSPTSPATPSPVPSPSPSGVESAARAAALVLLSDPRFVGVGPLASDVIGQSAWYEVSEAGDGWDVSVTIGWGDCMAGCIDRHVWRHHVSGSGEVTVEEEEGPELPAEYATPPVEGDAAFDVVVHASPTCPVETTPPDPACEPRAVSGATVIVSDPSGREVARAITDDAGQARISVPAGIYVIDGESVEGYLGDPEAVAAWAVGTSPTLVTLSYDTGIR